MHFILQETPYTICTLSTTNITVLLKCKHLQNPDNRLIFFQDNLNADSFAVGGKKTPVTPYYMFITSPTDLLKAVLFRQKNGNKV